MRVARKLHHIVFHASREGRASEIAAWSNALASIGLGIGSFVLTHSSPLATCAPIILFVLLRAALTNRVTIWIAGVTGTVAVAAVGGGLAWLFGHVIEIPSVPLIAAAIVALGSASIPVWAYRRLAQRRADDVRDSLIDPISVPSSRV
jgi:hypothetical protein